MKPLTITLPHNVVSKLLLHNSTVEQRLDQLNNVVDNYVLPAVLAIEQPTTQDAVLFVVKQTICQARRNNAGIVDSSNKIAQIKAFRETVGHTLFPDDYRRVLIGGHYLSHGCTSPGLAEAKRFVEDHWDLFQNEIG